jgi:outer membrane lipoprotein-sorting protein
MPGRTLMRIGWLLALVALLAGVLMTGGCAKRLTAKDIVTRMQETMGSTNDVHAIIEVTADVQGLSVQAVVEMWEKQPGKARAKLLEANPRRFAGSEIVTDGQTAWFYRPKEKELLVGSVSDMPAEAQAILWGMEGLIEKVLDASDVELLGKEEVDGTKAYKLSLTLKKEEEQSLPLAGTATLWVDQKQWNVLKAELVVPNFGEGTIRVQSFEPNPGLDDVVFTFEAPRDAEVVSVEDGRTQHITLDDAESQAGFDLLTPDYVPAGATLVDVLQVQGTFVLLYDLDGANLTVIQSQGPLPPEPLGVEEVVTVRHVQAALIIDEAAGASYLAWQENGVNFAISGRIDKDTVVRVAESLK